MNQPRWMEISKKVVVGLEIGVGQIQVNVFEAESELEALKSVAVEQNSQEDNAAFETRKLRYDRDVASIEEKIEMRRTQLRVFMQHYEDFIKGDTILGEKTGSLENVEGLFGGAVPKGKSE